MPAVPNSLDDFRTRLRASHPHRAVLEAAERVLDAEHEFLHQRVPASSGTWQQVTMMLVARALQLQRAILDGVTIGYDEEIHPVARAMMSTVISLAALVHSNRLADRDAKAVRYLTFGRKARRRQLEYLAKSHWITREQRLAYDAEATAEEDELLRRAAESGIVPLRGISARRTGKNDDRWTGFSDRELFKKMKVLRWYQHFYARWSDESHAQAVALVKLAEQYAATTGFDIGPHHRDPWFLLLATSEFGIQTLVQVNKAYRLGRREELKKLWGDTQREFSEIARQAQAKQ